jgi:outer membrane protein assembly factor BamB/predicted phosphodiesterase
MTSTSETSDSAWFASTRLCTSRISSDDPIVEVPDGSWLDIWSDRNIQPAAFRVGGEEICVDSIPPVISPREPKILHITDLHFSSARFAGPILGLEEFGDFTSLAGAQLDVLSTIRIASSDGALSAIVISGDLTDHGTNNEYIAFKKFIENLQVPVVTVPGNHDHLGEMYSGGQTRDVMGTANTRAFEQFVGPRWWARTLGGGLLVGLDWFSWKLGMDKEEQLGWLNSLGNCFRDKKNIVLVVHDEFHDSDWNDICSAIAPHKVTVLLSGHWHISRVSNDRGYYAFSTGSCTFGGLHMGPPEARVLSLSSRLEIQNSSTLIGTLGGWSQREPVPAGVLSRTILEETGEWETHVGCRLHRSNVLLTDHEVVVGGAYANRPGGVITWLDRMSGEALFDAVPPRGCVGPLTSGLIKGQRVCLFQTVVGTVGAVTWSGELLWETAAVDAPLRYTQEGIAVAGQRLVMGDIRQVSCIRVEDGSLVWSSKPNGTPENLISYGAPQILDDLVVFLLGGPRCGMVCFELNTGRVVWEDGGRRGIPASGLATDGELGFVLRSTGYLECFEIKSGRMVWQHKLAATLGGPAPFLVANQIVAITHDGYGVLIDSHGKPQMSFSVPDQGMRVGPYRNLTPFVTGCGTIGNAIWASCSSGAVMKGDLTDGLQTWRSLNQERNLTTSSARIVDDSSVMLLGFDGKVSLSKICNRDQAEPALPVLNGCRSEHG